VGILKVYFSKQGLHGFFLSNNKLGVMSSWSPITLAQLWDIVHAGEREMSPQLSRLWHVIRVDIAKWQLSPWGDLGNGFWVVGVIGNQVLWYNDIEDGFNWSAYSTFGVIGEYWCNQDELHHSIYQLQSRLDGKTPSPKAGPPQPLR